MALTYSQWIWGFQILDSGSGSAQNNLIDFVINSTTYQGGTAAAVAAGVYTPDEFAAAVQTALQAAASGSGFAPTCTFSYSTLEFTVACPGSPTTFSLLFSTGSDTTKQCYGLLGFAATNQTGATTYTGAAVGTSPSTANLWTAAEPLNNFSPVTAQAAGTAALLTQRSVRLAQHVSDGMTMESVYFGTMKMVQIVFRSLLTTEQTNMENFLNWVSQGNRFTWQPDKTSTSLLKLAMANPGQIANAYEWFTRPEVTYGTLTFVEQLS